MSNRKSSRHGRKNTPDDGSPKMVRVCKLNRTLAPPDVKGTSVYEIDIKSSFNSRNKGADIPQVKVCIANVAPITLEKNNNTKSIEFSIVENPFIESYYPRLQDTDSELDRRPTAGKNNSLSKNQRVSADDKKDAAVPKLKKQIKKQAARDFSPKTDSPRPLLRRKTPESELLHLHHHEHHHHYHFDKKKLQDGNDTALFSPKPSGGRRRFPRRRKTPDEDTPNHTFFYTCETTLPLNTDAHDRQEKPTRNHKPKPSTSVKTFRSRPSSSSESILNKKSHLIKTHNYSDTDIAKCDSDLNVSDSFLFEVHQKKDDSGTPAVPSAKTTTSAEDLKSRGKAVYVKYLIPRASETTIICTETETLSESLLAEEKENKDSDVTSEKNRSSSNDRPSNTWTEKIKIELKEIKKTLQIIEKEFAKNKTLPGPNVAKPAAKSEDSAREISVYSSKTFILKAENFYIIQDRENAAFNEDIESFFENDELCYAQTENGHFFLSPNGSWLHLKNEGRGGKKPWRTLEL